MARIKDFRGTFPLLTQRTYLNTAAWGLLSEPLMFWRQEHDLDFMIGGSEARLEQMKVLSETRTCIAEIFGGKKDRVALVQNFSVGLNFVLEGLPREWRILALENDYPSVNWPLRSRGFDLTYVPLKEDVEERITLALEEKEMDVLILSLVQWINGLMISPEFIRTLKSKYPELLIIVDGSQYLGAFALDFENSGIDVLGASGYKWLLGGNGNGFMMFSPLAEARLKIFSTGFNASGGNLDRENDITFAKRLEPGHLDTLCFGSLNFAMGMLQEIGLQTIHDYNIQRSASIKKILSELGLLEPEIDARGLHSTIFNLNPSKGLFEKLTEKNVVCSRRGSGIRISFHIYNDDNDLDKLVEVLK